MNSKKLIKAGSSSRAFVGPNTTVQLYSPHEQASALTGTPQSPSAWAAFSLACVEGAGGRRARRNKLCPQLTHCFCCNKGKAEVISHYKLCNFEPGKRKGKVCSLVASRRLDRRPPELPLGWSTTGSWLHFTIYWREEAFCFAFLPHLAQEEEEAS